MKILGLCFLAVLQPFFATGARRYSDTQPLLVVADVCGNNPNEVAQSYRARCVFCEKLCVYGGKKMNFLCVKSTGRIPTAFSTLA